MFNDLFDFILPKVDRGFYQTTSLSGPFKTMLLFSLVFGLMPIIIFLTWRYSPIFSGKKKLVSVFMVVVCMTLAIIARQQTLKLYFAEQTKNVTSTADIPIVNYPIDQVNFEYYLLGGLCVGCIASYVVLREKKV